MSEKKIIAVVGATGAQGGGLVRAILDDPGSGFTARVVARDPNSEKSRSFARRGAEVVQGDLDDPASLERAFAGADGAYCVTFFWAHFSPERELANARAMARAAKVAGVRHAIWSTLEDTRRFIPLSDPRMPNLLEHYKVPHFDAKGEADQAFTDSGVPTTFMLASFYWDNFIQLGLGPRRGDDGTYTFAMPLGERALAGIAAEDIGRCAYGIFRQGSALAGQRIGLASDHLTGAQLAAAFARVIGQPVRFQDVPFDVYRGLGFPGAVEMGNMFQFYHDCAKDVLGMRDVARTRALNPKLQSFDAFLAANQKSLAPVA